MLNVLVLDDDEVMKQIFRMYFKRTGIEFEMDFTQTATQAESRLLVKEYDLVFADYYLDNVRAENGIDFITKAMPKYPKTLFFLFSGYMDQTLIDIAVQAGLELSQLFGKQELSSAFIKRLLDHNADTLNRVSETLKEKGN